jgi:DNA-binding beta-propeller fold protein YncE
VGAAPGTTVTTDPFANLRCDTCRADLLIANAEDALNAPRGIAIGPENTIYVTDSRNARIVVYDADGQLLRTFGTLSVATDATAVPAPGTFREPWSVAVATDGTVYVADTWNHRVQVFTANGEYAGEWGSFEQADPNFPSGNNYGFYGPRDIAVDAQKRVYVADTGNKRVRVYDAQGAFLYDIGRFGREAGQLYEPVGLAIDDRVGELYVASTWNKRIDVFTLTGQYLRGFNVTAWYATTDTQDTGSRPYIALDPTGSYVFVTDPDEGRVLVYDRFGNPVVTFGRTATQALNLSQFGVLAGVKMDGEGRLFLVDAGGNRVLRFGRGTIPGVVPPAAGGPADLSGLFPTVQPTATATARDF